MQVGQTVWVTGGFGSRSEGATADVISKIGNKYFYLTGNPSKFDLRTLLSVGDSNYPYRVWLTIEEYKDSLELKELTAKLRSEFQRYSYPFTLDQLRRINAIIEEENIF